MPSIIESLLNFFKKTETISTEETENSIEMKYLIVALGNIGPKYALTRHNIGFIAADRIAALEDLSFEMEKLAYHTIWKTKGRAIHIIKPTTYMNLSGKSVQYWMNKLKIEKENVLVIVDDLALPVAKLRLKPKGSSAGHNGLKDMERIFGNTDYARLKIGIGDNFPKGRQIDYVLGEFNEDELIQMMQKIEKVKEIILGFCTIGINKTMNSCNE
jgi:peptidyl-tRNA hydrolase, PTH1 family